MLAQNIMKLLQKYGVNFLNGLGTTLLLALISVSIGCVIGALVAILRLGKSKVLRAVVEREKPDLVLLGKQAIDDDANQTGQMLSALCDMPLATFANEIVLEGGRWVVTRETDGGTQTVSLATPAVVTADLRLAEPRYVTLPAMGKARKKPVEDIELAGLGIDTAPRIRILGVEEPPARKAGVMVSGVDELVDRLKNEAHVI